MNNEAKVEMAKGVACIAGTVRDIVGQDWASMFRGHARAAAHFRTARILMGRLARLAPSRRRPRRVQAKIDARYGRLHYGLTKPS